jgi:carbon-monoxide dehydrogenase small subunit
MRVSLSVNGRGIDAEVEPRLLLVDLLREQLGLTGTKVACDTGQCGSCAVLIGERSAKSCSMLALQAEGGEITTIEGLSAAPGLNALQEALWAQHGVQCGFCTPGVIVALHDLLTHHDAPDEAEIRAALAGNLCRCTGYHSIVRAVLSMTSTTTGAGL